MNKAKPLMKNTQPQINPQIQELILNLGIIPDSDHYRVAQRVIDVCIAQCEAVEINPGSQKITDRSIGAMLAYQEIQNYFGIEE